MKHSILIVEDEPEISTLISNRLKEISSITKTQKVFILINKS